MKNAVSFVALLGLCALACVLQLRASAAQESPRWTTESVLKMMDKAASDFHSLTADIEHIKYTEVVKDTSTETGQIFVRRDQKMRIEFTKPDPRVILRTGDSLFVFTPKINRVEEYNLGKNRALVDQYVLLGFGTKSQNMEKSYDIALSRKSTTTKRLFWPSLPDPKTFASKSQKFRCGSTLLHGCRFSRNSSKPVPATTFSSNTPT